MRIINARNSDEMSKKASKIIAEQIKAKANSVLGLPTGNTPLGTYKELVRMHKEEGLDFSKVTVFSLNEYYGLGPENPYSRYHLLFETFFKNVNVDQKKIHTPDGLAKDVEAHCREYEEEIKKAGGIDFVLLGIGRNGHIGFNESGSSLTSRTRLVVLADETIRDNVRFFKSEEEIPRLAITMGCGTIIEAKKILLLALGSDKADAVAAMIEGPVTFQVPASILQMHPNVTVIIDDEAAIRLKKKPYYRYVERMLEEKDSKNHQPPQVSTVQTTESQVTPPTGGY